MYKGILSERGKTVTEENALGYALNSVLNDEEEKKAFIEWFYDGNWIKEDTEDERS